MTSFAWKDISSVSCASYGYIATQVLSLGVGLGGGGGFFLDTAGLEIDLSFVLQKRIIQTRIIVHPR